MRSRRHAHWVMWVLGIVVLGGAVTAHGQDPPKPEDFAFGYSLEARMGAPFQEIVLPADFYRGVTQGDLRDSAVFDADRGPVPHVYRVPGQTASIRTTEWLPIFPVSGRRDRGTGGGGLSLSLKRAPDGTLLEVKTDPDPEPVNGMTGYVLDASFLHDPYSALELKIGPTMESQLFRVHLQGSDDLTRWELITHSQTIGRLSHEGRLIEKDRVEFHPCRYRYLRLTWYTEGDPLQLHEARVEFSKSVTEDLHEWEVLAGQPKQNDEGYHFDTRGLFPVDKIKVVFPGTNVAVPVKTYSRSSAEQNWRFRSEALVHRLNVEGKVYSAEDVRLTDVVRDRYWKVVETHAPVEARKAVRPVELHVGWIPARLVFLAQGKGPYTLAFGSSLHRTEAFPLQSLLDKVAPEARSRLLVGAATMSAMQTLGGEKARRPVKPPLAWKHWILWAVLLTGVALMGWMALKLHRQLSRQGSDAGDGPG